tara:strand:+ start:286 stop:471 length:186 start_codon:yes stop_codon:yes gene_type:complete
VLGFRIFSPDPALMRARLALLFAYKPRFGLFAIIFSSSFWIYVFWKNAWVLLWFCNQQFSA